MTITTRSLSQIFCFAFLVLASPGMATPGRAQEGTIKQNDARDSDLIVQWFTQTDALDESSIVGLQLVVDENDATTFFHVAGGGFSRTISEKGLNPYGEPFGSRRIRQVIRLRSTEDNEQLTEAELQQKLEGEAAPTAIEEAREYAELEKELIAQRMKKMEIDGDVTLDTYVVPSSTLFTLTTSGALTALDAETGERLWQIFVGDRRLPFIGMAASKSHVVVVNGISVYCISSNDGKVLWNRKLKGSPSAAPVLNDRYVFIPTDDGKLETMSVDTDNLLRSTYVAVGLPVGNAGPIVDNKSVAWVTDRGVTVAPAYERGKMRYRVDTESEVAASPAAKNGLMFVAARNGFVYAIDDLRGALLWEIAIGERVSRSPVVIGDDLFIVSDNDNLYRFDARTGNVVRGWERPLGGITKILGATDSVLYAINSTARLVTLSRDNGIQLGSMPERVSTRSLTNLDTNRLYVCLPNGMIECLRETTAERLRILSGEWSEVAAVEDSSGSSSNATMENESSGATNPFGDASGSSDPFGGSGASSDPFGGSGNSSSTDPFGGASGSKGSGGSTDDPFGGSASGNKGASGGGNDPFGGSAGSGASLTGNREATTKLVVWKDVSGIFDNNCAKCHRGANAKGGFDASSFESVMSHGDDLVTPGDGAASRLYQLVAHEDEPAMPPGGKKIPNADLKKIREWIDSGALEVAADAPGQGAGSGNPGADPFGG